MKLSRPANRPVRVFRMIVRKLFLESHGIIGLKRSIRPIP